MSASVHDLGGAQGFGPVEAEADEPPFHGAWEARMFALASAVPFAVPFGDDQFRPAIERMSPEHYMRSSYYEKWYTAVTTLLFERGAVTAGELAGGPIEALPMAIAGAQPLRAGAVRSAIFDGASQARPADGLAPRRFRDGAQVITSSSLPAGHNRLPRYARGRIGTIAGYHGAFLVADRNSVGDRTPDHLYTVLFRAEDLWGAEAVAGDTLSLDLWECYLREPAP